MIHVIASIVVKPEHAAAAAAMLIDLAGKTRHERGCASYEVFQRADAPHAFQTVEEWHSGADVDAHMTTPHVAAVLAAAGPMLASPPAILRYAKIG